MIEPIADIAGAKRALRIFLVHAEGKLDAELFDQVEALVDSPSPVDAICKTAELLYARRDDLELPIADEARELVAALAAFAAENGWHGMAINNRGGLIAQAMKRELAIKIPAGQAKPQKPDEDPAPLDHYVVAPAEEAVPAAPQG